MRLSGFIFRASFSSYLRLDRGMALSAYLLAPFFTKYTVPKAPLPIISINT